jgi:hypothetical protein
LRPEHGARIIRHRAGDATQRLLRKRVRCKHEGTKKTNAIAKTSNGFDMRIRLLKKILDPRAKTEAKVAALRKRPINCKPGLTQATRAHRGSKNSLFRWRRLIISIFVFGPPENGGL